MYLLAVLVGMVYMSLGLTELYSLARSMYQPRYLPNTLTCRYSLLALGLMFVTQYILYINKCVMLVYLTVHVISYVLLIYIDYSGYIRISGKVTANGADFFNASFLDVSYKLYML